MYCNCNLVFQLPVTDYSQSLNTNRLKLLTPYLISKKKIHPTSYKIDQTWIYCDGNRRDIIILKMLKILQFFFLSFIIFSSVLVSFYIMSHFNSWSIFMTKGQFLMMTIRGRRFPIVINDNVIAIERI